MALDGLSVDQLRTFIAAAEQRSFSAAARKLRRAQSVVSQTLANLELQIGVKLFDRSGRYPQLTPHGEALLRDAKRVAEGMDSFKARAKTLREGLEPELSVVIDVMYPMSMLTPAVGSFRTTFPDTPLRLYVEALGAVIQPVLDGRCQIGVVGALPIIADTLQTEALLEVPMVTVVSPTHALASIDGVISTSELAKHVQLVLTDRSKLTAGQSYGIHSPQTWRLADLGAKHWFLRAGFGYGHMPRFMVADDIASGALKEIRIAALDPRQMYIPMSAAYRRDSPPGPAARWLIDRLRQCTDHVEHAMKNGARKPRARKK